MSKWKGRADRTADAIALLAEISRQNDVDVATLRTKEKPGRSSQYVKIRQDFCCRGRAMGINVVELAIALNRDHSTVSYHSRPHMRAAKAERHVTYRAEQKQQRKQRNSERAAFA